MESYEARGIVSEIHDLLGKLARGEATESERDRAVIWEGRAAAMLANPSLLPDLAIITNEHNCNGDLEAKDGFIPSSIEELASCEAYRYSVKHPAHFRREPVARIEVVVRPKVLDIPSQELQRVQAPQYTATSQPYIGPGGRRCTDSCQSSPEAWVADEDGELRPVGAASALLARLLEAKAAGE